ncbi:MAG: ATP synthase F0 subunit B [Candidatus Buchananbacteria bacterium RIFCSPLOWO2_01_FULL_56_15]|uniref:ATP synthase subunit b n=2 Tax=Candidatus Buchananiibacteriota TaxID=1817903 RepID=A0A1G1YFX9_9BACT|nr:MAG: ATP synthase F0 subunit B [Candidatus Buchananbacteria bacterium RIFCSPHIGHO2_02_FULL_56_16]OGY54663.1 MAG: ATP synthase F0 subunit B [Candidatus Buchananbacteria bacterium RIFCSPLOWO2_01_FULL_56_15]
MESIITTFHIDWKLIIAQLVNFAIVVGVLWFFVLKPLTKVMAERTATIEKSLRDAEAVKQHLRRAEEEKQAVIREAQQSARQIIEAAKVTAVEQQKKTVAAARQEVEKVITEGKQQLRREQTQMVAEVKAEVAEVVALAAGKVLAGVMTKPIDRALAQQALDTVTRTKGADRVSRV